MKFCEEKQAQITFIVYPTDLHIITCGTALQLLAHVGGKSDRAFQSDPVDVWLSKTLHELHLKHSVDHTLTM
jgi:hypothetical protein